MTTVLLLLEKLNGLSIVIFMPPCILKESILLPGCAFKPVKKRDKKDMKLKKDLSID
jgi:hypothetical protein